MKKYLLAAWLVLGGVLTLGADGVKVGANIHFTDTLVQQSQTTLDGTSEWSKMTSKKAPWYAGNTFGRQDLYFQADSAVWNFYTAFRFDGTSAAFSGITALNEAHATLKLADGALKVRSGLYQEQSFGYGMEGFETGPLGRYLAADGEANSYRFTQKSDTRFLTSVEWSPEEWEGLSVLLALPIEPNGNYDGVMADKAKTDANPSWLLTNTMNRFRVGVRYSLPDGGVLKAVYQNALWSNQVVAASGDKSGRLPALITDTTKGLSEAFVGLDEFPLVEGLSLKAGYGFQVDPSLQGAASQHQIFTSVGWDITDSLRLTVDNAVTMATADWANAYLLPGSSKLRPTLTGGGVLYDQAKARAALTLDGLIVALSVNGGYEPATNGHLYTYGQAYVDAVNKGNDGSAYSLGAAPQIIIPFDPGTVSIGFNAGFLSNQDASGTSNSAFGWSIPIDCKLSF